MKDDQITPDDTPQRHARAFMRRIRRLCVVTPWKLKLPIDLHTRREIQRVLRERS